MPSNLSNLFWLIVFIAGSVCTELEEVVELFEEVFEVVERDGDVDTSIMS